MKVKIISKPTQGTGSHAAFKNGGKIKKAKIGDKLPKDIRDYNQPINYTKQIPSFNPTEVQRKNWDMQASFINAAPEPISFIDKMGKIARNPMTAIQSMNDRGYVPNNFDKGERNIFDYAVDVVNPMQYIDMYKAASNLQGGKGTFADIINFIPGEGEFNNEIKSAFRQNAEKTFKEWEQINRPGGVEHPKWGDAEHYAAMEKYAPHLPKYIMNKKDIQAIEDLNKTKANIEDPSERWKIDVPDSKESEYKSLKDKMKQWDIESEQEQPFKADKTPITESLSNIPKWDAFDFEIKDLNKFIKKSKNKYFLYCAILKSVHNA